MSRVERTEDPREQQARRAHPRARRQDDPAVTHTPGKAEGEAGDIEEALDRQSERITRTT